ncbi:MAG: alpha/beta fold hydrolase [Bacteroidales bacterium]|nr:alpha/beta fold hydrolase [Bacteroidales bacterium]MDD4032002.1 alpha/beta fold hydrolase [Bacteroidales bacterium]
MAKSYYSGEVKESSIKIEKERFKVTKITFSIKSNRNDSISADLFLPVHIIHTKSTNPKEPIFWFAGGPGISNLNFKPPKILLENHDVVLTGYRGIDGSVILKSKGIKKAIKGINDSLLSEESIENLQNATKKYINGLKEKNIDLKDFTIIDVVDDFEEVRKLLGYEKINLLSASYGTRCALFFGYKYPNSINKSIMIGVNPPGHFVWWPVKTQEIIKKYDSLCNLKDTDNLTIEESIELSFKNMPKKWTFFKLDSEKIKATSFVLMYRKPSAIMVFDSFRKAAEKGDYSGLYLMQLAYDYLVPKMFTWGDLFNKGASADFDKSLNYSNLLKPDTLKIGAPLSLLIWSGGLQWESVLIEEEYRKVQYSEVQTLMIGGNLDVSTPPEYAAEKLLPQMPNTKQVILKEMSHVDDIMGLQKEAFNNLVSKYYLTGEIDTTMYKYDSVKFKTTVSFNWIAKILYPIVLIMSWFK